MAALNKRLRPRFGRLRLRGFSLMLGIRPALKMHLRLAMESKRFCRKVRFWGKIQKSGIRNSTTYRLPNSRKSNFATEPSRPLESLDFTSLTLDEFQQLVPP